MDKIFGQYCFDYIVQYCHEQFYSFRLSPLLHQYFKNIFCQLLISNVKRIFLTYCRINSNICNIKTIFYEYSFFIENSYYMNRILYTIIRQSNFLKTRFTSSLARSIKLILFSLVHGATEISTSLNQKLPVQCVIIFFFFGSRWRKVKNNK